VTSTQQELDELLAREPDLALLTHPLEDEPHHPVVTAAGDDPEAYRMTPLRVDGRRQARAASAR